MLTPIKVAKQKTTLRVALRIQNPHCFGSGEFTKLKWRDLNPLAALGDSCASFDAPPILGVKKICNRGMRTVHQYRSLTFDTVLAYDEGIPSMQLSFEQTANDAVFFTIDEPMPRLVSELRAVLRSPHTTAEDRIQRGESDTECITGCSS